MNRWQPWTPRPALAALPGPLSCGRAGQATGQQQVAAMVLHDAGPTDIDQMGFAADGLDAMAGPPA